MVAPFYGLTVAVATRAGCAAFSLARNLSTIGLKLGRIVSAEGEIATLSVHSCIGGAPEEVRSNSLRIYNVREQWGQLRRELSSQGGDGDIGESPVSSLVSRSTWPMRTKKQRQSEVSLSKQVLDVALHDAPFTGGRVGLQAHGEVAAHGADPR